MNRLIEKSPPGWSGTVKAMKKHMSPEKAFALAWSMYKKGAKPHYKALPSSTSDEKPELKKKYKGEHLSDQLSDAIAEKNENVNTDNSCGCVYDIDSVFEDVVGGEITERGHHYYDGKDYYVDTAFINSIGKTISGMKLSGVGLGEYSLKGNGKSIEFDRSRGKKFEGQSGKSHRIIDNKDGSLVKELIRKMETKGRSDLVREDASVCLDGVELTGIAGQLESALFLERRKTPSERKLEPGELRSDNPELVSVLMRSVEQTRQFVRAVYHVEEVASELVHAAKETERIRRTVGVERAMQRSTLGNAARSFEAETRKIYGHFAEGRNAMTRLAKMAGISTRRAGKRKAASKATKEITMTDLVRDVLQISSRLGSVIREAAEMGSVTIREGEKLLNQKSVIEGDKLRDRLSAYVQAYLDFRDLVASGLYTMIAGVVRRLNEMTKRLMQTREGIDRGMYVISLPWDSDKEFEKAWEDENFVLVNDDEKLHVNGWLEAIA